MRDDRNSEARAEPVDWRRACPVAEWLAWLVAGTVSGLVPLE